MKELLSRAIAWFRDYVYVAFHQVRGLLLRPSADRWLNDVDPAAVPVLLIPGIYEPWHFLHPLADTAHRLGHPVHVVPALGYNRGTVPAMADHVAAYLAAQDLADVVVLAHSKGGLIGKHVMGGSAEAWRIRSMIAVSTPFSGSVYARFAPLRSIRSFSPADEVLRRLAENLTVNGRIISVYSIFDPHIPAGSFLDRATNIELDTMGHFRIIGDARLLQVVQDQLRGQPRGCPAAE